MLAVDRRLLDVARFEDRVAAARGELAGDPGARPRPPRGRARRVARTGARRRRRRGLGAAGGGAVGRAAPGGAGDPLRRPARPRPPRRGGRRARAHGRRAPAPRGLRPAADDRPLPQRPPGRRAARVPPDAERCSPTSSGSTRRRSSSSCRRAILNHDPELAAPASPWTPPVSVAAAARRAGRPRGAEPGPSPVPLPGGGRCGRAAGRSSAATASSAELHRIWATITTGGTHLALLAGRGRRRQVAPRRPLRRRRSTASAPSSCGAGRRPR